MSAEEPKQQVPADPKTESSTEQKSEDNQETSQSIEEFTKEPLHHGPYDGLEPEIVEDDWELSLPGSGFQASLPNNPEWPVTERLIYNYTEEEISAIPSKETIAARKKAAFDKQDAPKTALVTGAAGLIGSRLVTMLVQRGAKRVVAVDVLEFSPELKESMEAILTKEVVDNVIQFHSGTIENCEFITPLLQDVQVVYNCAGIVNYFKHPKVAYERINHVAVSTLVKVAEECNVAKFVQVSSPTARMDLELGDIINATETDLPAPFSFEYQAEYARTKALGEKIVMEHNSEKMMTICISPHQVYGPNDKLLLAPALEAAIQGDLRIIGDGQNKVSICHIDNACHALILASASLKTFDVAPAGNVYIITDDRDHYYWALLDDLLVRGGLESLKTRIKAPGPIAKFAGLISKLVDHNSRFNPWTVRMMSQTHTFNITAAKTDLGYESIISWEEEWVQVCKALLQRFGQPCYNTKFYYEGVQFEGMSKEIAKREAEERAQREAIEKAQREADEAKRAEEAAKQAEEDAKKAEEDAKNQPQVDEQTKVDEQPKVIVAPKVEEKKVEPKVEEKKVEPKVEEQPKVEEPKVEEPIVEEQPIVEEPKVEEEPHEQEEQQPQEQEEEQPQQQEEPQQKKKGKKNKH